QRYGNVLIFFFSGRRRHTSSYGNWSSDVCSSDLVAATIANGLVNTADVTLPVVAAGLAGGIIWNLIPWLFGIPSSSSHALIGGVIGRASCRERVRISVVGVGVKIKKYIVRYQKCK